MELFSGLTYSEERLSAKTRVLNLPFGGTMELLPLCNMDCKMCYIKQSKAEMEAQGKMLSLEQWIKIAESAKRAGVLHFLITGGEPLLYPHFKELYIALTEMGFIFTINTNGTLINEEWADLFSKRPCRRINITYYGKDADTYERLCGNRKGYDQMIEAVKLLKERNVSVRLGFTTTPYNMDQQDDFFQTTETMKTGFICTTYCFPPYRKNKDATEIERLSPKQAAEAKLNYIYYKNKGIPKEIVVDQCLNLLKEAPHNAEHGYFCGAGRNAFWINWKGELLPCGMFKEPAISLLDYEFKDAWEKMSEEHRNTPFCTECENCRFRNLCTVCQAASVSETGNPSGKPEYLCKMTKEYTKLLLNAANPETRLQYEEIVEPYLDRL